MDLASATTRLPPLHQTHFRSVWTNFGFRGRHALGTYLEYVAEDPARWASLLPEGSSPEQAVAAINALPPSARTAAGLPATLRVALK